MAHRILKSAEGMRNRLRSPVLTALVPIMTGVDAQRNVPTANAGSKV
jgi:hypothetical protein